MQKSAGSGSMGLTKTALQQLVGWLAWPRAGGAMGVLWLVGRKNN